LAKEGEGGSTAASLALRFSHPEFLVSRWLERFGREQAIRVFEADNAGSPLDLVVNPRKTGRDALARALEAEGVATKPSSLSPLGLTVLAGHPLASPLLAAGHFSVQDIGSQLLPLLLPAGDLLLDLAAAPGGKSFAALGLGRARRVVCLDISAGRLSRLVANRERLGMRQAFPVAADVLALPFSAATFHRILFDAPCSGTGTLRKNPEIRYRITPQTIERLSRAQERGLGAAARLLAPGGYLLYATCSLELEENERVVERVLAAMLELEPAPIAADDALKPFVDGNRFRILPGPTSDGFTAHLLRRRLGATMPTLS
jgi:16S rRNA (cytosine967-C5)-methyltransferase